MVRRSAGDRRQPDLSLTSGTPFRLRASRLLLRQSTSGLQPSTAPRLTAPVLHLRQSGTASVAAVNCISVGLHLRQLCKFTCGRPISTRQLRQHHNMWRLRSLEMMKKNDISLFELWGQIFKGKESNFYIHTNSFYCTFVVVVCTRIPRRKFLAPPLLTTCS